MKAARRLFLSVDSEALLRPNRYLGQAVGSSYAFWKRAVTCLLVWSKMGPCLISRSMVSEQDCWRLHDQA